MYPQEKSPPEPVVGFSRNGGVGTILFNRPKANGYEIGFMTRFNEAIEAANAVAEVRVVIVRSALAKFFCAGADIQAFAKNTVAENKAMVVQGRRALEKIEASGKIFIAELNGHTLGGGLEIALACDLRFGGDGAYTLGLPEVKLGLTPGNGGSQRLPRVIGPSKALELLITGESIGPREAFRIGLLNRLYPATDLQRETEKFALSLASGASLAIAAIKRGIRAGAVMSLQDSLALEAALVEPLYATHDAREGFLAFTEKRPPVYRGN